MSITKPFKSVYRTTVSDDIRSYDYVDHPDFSGTRIDKARMYRLLEDRIKHLFRLIEPDPGNKDVFSYEISSLLISVCVEVENCLKEVILNNSRWNGKTNLNMPVYAKVEPLLMLNKYELILNISNNWSFRPFENWTDKNPTLDWYQAYNKVKHNRSTALAEATYELLLNAFAGLTALQLSMFGPYAFIEGPMHSYGSLAIKPEGGEKGFILPDGRTVFTIISGLQFDLVDQYDIDSGTAINFASGTQIVISNKPKAKK